MVKICVMVCKAGIELLLVITINVGESSIHDHVCSPFIDGMKANLHESADILRVPK